MKRIIMYLICVVSIAFPQIPSSILKDLSPDIKRQIASNKNISGNSNIDYLDINKIINKKIPTPQTISDTTDTSFQKDSLLSAEIEEDTFSIYQKIVRGDTINPDSMLKTITIFGHDIFSKANPSTFAPTDNFSIPSNYIINTDDEVVILIWGRINEEYQLKVTRDGTINIPRIGPIPVSGLPFETMQKNILSRIERIEGINASVSIGTMRTIGVFIVGEVKSPGFYTVSALSNVTNALFSAGGVNKNGSLRNIQLKRDEKIVATIDLYEFLLQGKNKTALRLQPGDVIHVPNISKMVAVTGNVRRSALFEILGNEKLNEVISLAGGFSPTAWTNRIQINRFTENKQQEIIDVDSLKTELNSFTVYDGDIIKVFPILFKDQNAVYLEGNVVRPGRYEFRQGMRISDLIHDYKQLLAETYLDYALIIRQDPPQFLNQVITFNLKDALNNTASDKDPALQARDKVIIYNQDYFEPDRSVEIIGSVTAPGKIKLLHNMAIRDLILQAGGLSEDASSTRGELYRRTLQQNDVIKTEKIDFCVECAMKNDPSHNLVLSRSDRIFIRSKLGWEKESKVTLNGQFKFPGVYVIFENETLGELIDRAGGFSSNAYLSAAVFTRASVKLKEESFFDEYSGQLEKEIINLSNEIASKTDPLEAKALLEQQNTLKKDLSRNYKFGRVVIDLNDKKNYKDFTLENGDELLIPKNLNTVSVLGEVFNPSTFKFEENNNVSYYIEAAGGLKNNSDKKHIYIIKANGSIVTNNTTKISTSSLKPGDAIVVPQKLRYSNPHKLFVDSVDAVFKIFTVFGTILTIVVTMNNIN